MISLYQDPDGLKVFGDYTNNSIKSTIHIAAVKRAATETFITLNGEIEEEGVCKFKSRNTV